MAQNKVSSLEQTTKKVLIYQFSQGIGCCILVTLLLKNFDASLSAILGLLTGLIPTLIYTSVVLNKPIASPHITLKRHQKAMYLKFISNILGFLIIFLVYKGVYSLPLFVTYVVTLSGHWTSLRS